MKRTYTLKLTKGELETIQLLLEVAATGASIEQITVLEAIDGKIYREIFPDLVIHRANANPTPRSHPLPLANLRLVKTLENKS